MTNEEKQIEEMASVIHDVVEAHHISWCMELAKHLITKKGYRRASEVAREIFAELELKAPFFCENQVAYEHFNEDLAELRKKYESEENKE